MIVDPYSILIIVVCHLFNKYTGSYKRLIISHMEHILWSTLDLHIVQIGYNILIPLPLPDCSQKGVLAVLITFYQPPQFSVRTVSTSRIC